MESNKKKHVTQKMEDVIGVVIEATKGSKMFEHFPDIDRYADYFMTSVDVEFRGQGLVTVSFVAGASFLKNTCTFLM